MSCFHLHGYTKGARTHTEECDTAGAALGIGRRLAAHGAVVFAFVHRDDGRLQDVALFIDDNMLPNRTLAPGDNPLLAIGAGSGTRDRRRAPQGGSGGRHHRNKA